MQTQKSKDKFPIVYLMMYIVFYAGQLVYDTYLNLYLNQIGMSATEIGTVISISTVGILFSQLFWGRVSDRTGKKVMVLRILYCFALVFSLSFYVTKNYLFVCLLVTLFGMMFAPVMPLMDNVTLETLGGGKWDFGQIRAGGTFGYSLMALVSGFLLKDRYSGIFLWLAICLVLCLVCTMGLGFVPKREKEKKAPEDEARGKTGKGSLLAVVFRDKTLLGLIGFQLMHGLGVSFFTSYYPIYFTSIGGDSKLVGILMFACAISEIPFFIGMSRIVKRLGAARVLFIAGLLTGCRWLMLGMVRNPYLAIPCNMLQGFSFTAVTWCLLNYINRKVPYEYRARTQVLGNVISMVCGRFIFGYLGGRLFDSVGAPRVLLGLGIFMAAAGFGAGKLKIEMEN